MTRIICRPILSLTLSLPWTIIIGFCKHHRSRWDGSHEPSHLDLRCMTFSILTLRINFFSSDRLFKKKKTDDKYRLKFGTERVNGTWYLWKIILHFCQGRQPVCFTAWQDPSENGLCCKERLFGPRGSKFFSYRSDTFLEEDKNVWQSYLPRKGTHSPQHSWNQN